MSKYTKYEVGTLKNAIFVIYLYINELMNFLGHVVQSFSTSAFFFFFFAL